MSHGDLNCKQQSSMSNVLLTPSASAKIKNRESARKLKDGSPKLQEVLRQRCREHMRAKRGQLFNESRSGLSDNDKFQALTEIVRQELSSLVTSEWIGSGEVQVLDPDEALNLENIILAEQEMWIREEYERFYESEQEMLASYMEESLKDELICPACQKSTLTAAGDIISCNYCSLTLPGIMSLTSLGKIINNNVALHAENCSQVPNFTVVSENNDNSLYLVCEQCSTLFSII